MIVFYMAAVIHIIIPQYASVFGEYTQMHLLPYLQSQMTDITMGVDAVWDRYIARQVSSPKLVSTGMGLQGAEHESQQ